MNVPCPLSFVPINYFPAESLEERVAFWGGLRECDAASLQPAIHHTRRHCYDENNIEKN